jgi:hypothetical protein
VVVALVVTATIGATLGFFWFRGENETDRRLPDRTPTLAADEFAPLVQRAVRPPRLNPRKGCPDPSSPDATELPGVPAEAGRGRAPVYVVHQAIPRFLDFFSPSLFAEVDESRGWRGALALVVVDPTYRGPVLIRGGYVAPLADGEATSDKPRLGFGKTARPSRALRLPSTLWRTDVTPRAVWGHRLNLLPRWRAVTAVVRTRREGCYFYQVDGLGFSHRFLFGALWQ